MFVVMRLVIVRVAMKGDLAGRRQRFGLLGALFVVITINLAGASKAGASEMLPDLIAWAEQSQNFLYGYYMDTNQIPGHTLLRLSTAVANVGTGPLEIRGSSTSPDVFQRIYLSEGGYTDRYAGTFTFHPEHGHLHYDNWAQYSLRAVLTNNAVGDIVVYSAKMSSAIVDVQRYDASLPGSPTSAQYFGGYKQGISVGWSDVYGANLDEQWIDVTGVPNGHYWLEEVIDPLNNIKEANETNNTSRILIDLVTAPASNNNFTNATLIPGVAAGLYGSNAKATRESGEPFHFANQGGASVWYKWIAPSNMSVTITTEGTKFDTILGVYRGTAVNALTLVTNNDDVTPGTTYSRVTFNATNGITYCIAIDGYGTNPPANGNFQLNFNPALNDNFSNALLLTGNSGSVSGSSRGATKQGGEPKHAGANGGASIWYNWTASVTGPVAFDTLGSGFDTVLGIYTGATINTLTVVASDDNSGGAGASRVTLSATNGITYRIAVDGKNGSNGIVNLNWLGPGLPTIAAQPLATNNVSGATVGFRVVAVSSSPLSYRWMFQGTNLTDSASISGSTNSALTVFGISTNNQGTYTARISNSFGSITSAPANLIVLDSPRAVYAADANGEIAGTVSVPIKMQAIGNEHALNFSLIFDPAILTNPRLSNNLAGTTINIFTNQVGIGRLGATFTLGTNQTVGAGTTQWTVAVFDVVAGLTNGTTTFVGFGDQPIAKDVRGTNGASLSVVFAAGRVAVYSPKAIESGARLADGRYQLSFGGLINRSYAILVSSNLTSWISVKTNVTGADGSTVFVDNQSTNLSRRFYRALLLP